MINVGELKPMTAKSVSDVCLWVPVAPPLQLFLMLGDQDHGVIVNFRDFSVTERSKIDPDAAGLAIPKIHTEIEFSGLRKGPLNENYGNIRIGELGPEIMCEYSPGQISKPVWLPFGAADPLNPVMTQGSAHAYFDDWQLLARHSALDVQRIWFERKGGQVAFPQF